jgi:GNAT superfamily N-acetyltransferase
MIPCDDAKIRLEFCHRDYLRYRELIGDLLPPSAWDGAMERYWVNDGRLVDRGEQAREPAIPDHYYVDSLRKPSLLACVHVVKPRAKLRLEGEIPSDSDQAVRAWIRELAPVGVATTHEAIKCCLAEELGVTDWIQAGRYTVTTEDFMPRVVHPVRLLSPADRPLWQRFVGRNMDDSMVSGRNGCGSVVRDYEFMCMAMPVAYYAAEKDGEITGIFTIGASTDRYDNIGALFVAPEHRRQGFGYSLLSAVTQDILARGRQPDYFAGGDPDALPPLLSGLGYHLNFTFYWTERFMWYDWVLAQEP